MASDASETQALAAAAAAPDRASTADVPMAVGGERQPADALAHLNALPAWLQWVLSLVLLPGMVAWLLLGNVAAGTIGAADCPLDAWLVPVVAGVIAYTTAYGFFGTAAKDIATQMLPMLVGAGFAALFAWRGALLPFIIGGSSTSFMLVLTVFNSGLQVDGPNGKKVVDYSFEAYRGYVSTLLATANGVINALGWMIEHELGGSKELRWVVACFFPPLVLLLPALIAMAKGDPNGQYNVPDNGTFVRLYITTRLGIYFCMYFFVHVQCEAIITREVLALNANAANGGV